MCNSCLSMLISRLATCLQCELTCQRDLQPVVIRWIAIVSVIFYGSANQTLTTIVSIIIQDRLKSYE